MRAILAIVIMITLTSPVFGYAEFIQTIHSDIPQERANQISESVTHLSNRFSIPSDVIMAVIWQESQFRNGYSNVDRNPCSAGYMQLLRTTATSLYHKSLSCHDLIVKWRLNLFLGVKYLSKMYDHTNRLAGAISAYNGRNNLDYVRDVLNKREEIIQWRRSK